ncbi:hypothetical protein [Campylobacter canadensis]|uniref:Periplasmic protein n=1 Tax=Campylobacter canadensis TaxID=449520 RepID=A0ABS7WS21_9BACT|nr:hypothetical protein [Campylobacter canadensis]MBZ7987555.1 hypothetical protein [Campylobacter canadensis]MBZ7994900.1 hypothetical protein [Campylobacter canadensis]MBZ7996713.1 hypothetical protein [Campylobacter canadensis]MBZ7998689.1 hypothetical protein [Campylobacter canadensis]MBZ8000317.1 hypothetical protein [Campylobacter canadensis]
MKKIIFIFSSCLALIMIARCALAYDLDYPGDSIPLSEQENWSDPTVPDDLLGVKQRLEELQKQLNINEENMQKAPIEQKKQNNSNINNTNKKGVFEINVYDEKGRAIKENKEKNPKQEKKEKEEKQNKAFEIKIY